MTFTQRATDDMTDTNDEGATWRQRENIGIIFRLGNPALPPSLPWRIQLKPDVLVIHRNSTENALPSERQRA